MKQDKLNLGIKIGLSILVAFMLTILPLPSSLQWWQPSWLLLVLIFWIFAQPTALGLGIIWCLGLYLDLLSDTLLGQHTIALLIVTYFLLKFQSRISIFPFARQFLAMLLLIIIYYGVQYQLARWAHPFGWSLQLFYPVISTSLLWILVYKLLKNYEHHLRKW